MPSLKTSQSGVSVRMLLLGRTAGLSSDPCVLTLACGAAFSLNHLHSVVLAWGKKGLTSVGLGKTVKGKGGTRRQLGKMEKRGMSCRITQQC